MKKNTIIKTMSAGLIGTLLLTGCSSKTQYLNASNENLDSTQAPITLGIDRRDFEKAADGMVSSILTSGVLNIKNSKRSIILMSDIINDTTQRIDTRMLTKKIRTSILRSKQAIFTNAIGTQRDDTTVFGSRELRGNDEFDQKTLPKKRALIGADFGLSGRIIQKTTSVDEDDQIVEYYFQMELTSVKDGLAYWEDEIIIGKVGSNDSVSW